MEYSHAYENNGSRWILVVNKQSVQVFCDGESRTYTIPQPIMKITADKQYVFIYVEHPVISFYQFKFEDNQFLVGDTFDKNDEHLNEFACHVFGEES